MLILAGLSGSLVIVVPAFVLVFRQDHPRILGTERAVQVVAVLVLLASYELATRQIVGCRLEQGKDKFYSFCRRFFPRLFHESVGASEREADLEKLIGRVPYLNGGIFDVQKLESSKQEGGYGDDI